MEAALAASVVRRSSPGAGTPLAGGSASVDRQGVAPPGWGLPARSSRERKASCGGIAGPGVAAGRGDGGFGVGVACEGEGMVAEGPGVTC